MKTTHMTGFWAASAGGSHREPTRRNIASSGKGKIGAWEISSWIAAQLGRWIPEGHEDEEGFHFGPPPAVSLYDAAPVDAAAAGREG